MPQASRRRRWATWIYAHVRTSRIFGQRFRGQRGSDRFRDGRAEIERIDSGGGGEFVHETFVAKLLAVAASPR